MIVSFGLFGCLEHIGWVRNINRPSWNTRECPFNLFHFFIYICTIQHFSETKQEHDCRRKWRAHLCCLYFSTFCAFAWQCYSLQIHLGPGIKCERQHLHTPWKRLPPLAAFSEWSADHYGSLRSSSIGVCQGKPAGVSSRRVQWARSP